MLGLFGFGPRKTPGEKALDAVAAETKPAEAAYSGSGFDPTGLERAAKAAKAIDASPNAKLAFDVVSQHELTKQLEHSTRQAAYEMQRAPPAPWAEDRVHCAVLNVCRGCAKFASSWARWSWLELEREYVFWGCGRESARARIVLHQHTTTTTTTTTTTRTRRRRGKNNKTFSNRSRQYEMGRVKEEAEEARRTLQAQTEHANRQAEYSDELERKRYAAQLQAQRDASHAALLPWGSSLERERESPATRIFEVKQLTIEREREFKESSVMRKRRERAFVCVGSSRLRRPLCERRAGSRG